MGKEFFSVENLSAGYGRVQILKEVSFSLNRGEIVSLVGESGSGKSTLFNSILGIEEGLWTSEDSVFFKGRSLKDNPSFIGQEIGAVFQNSSYSLVDTRLISSQFEETVRVHKKIKKDEIENKAIELLAKLHLQDPENVYHSYPFQLSGGMKQRVSIGLSLILSPSLLICDEPTSALDVQIENEIIKLFKDLKEKNNLSILLITHNLELAEYLSDRIIVFYGGRILEYRDRDKLVENPLHPYTQDLFGVVPKFLSDIPKPIKGQAPNFPLSPGCVYLDRCKRTSDSCRNWHMRSYPVEGGELACLMAEEKVY